MRFQVLGPVEVTGDEGPLPLGGPVQRQVLAHLLCRPNEVVSADVLIDDVWGEDPPASARNTLQSYVSRLRTVLGAERLEHRPPGYVLRLAPEELDVVRFTSGLQEARAADGHPERVSRVLAEALSLWKGDAYAGVSSPTLSAEATRLEELRLQALEERIAADLELGRHGDIVGELEALARRHPLRERLWGQLMLALYRSGRQGDALAAFGRAREYLADELGVDPSAELASLHERILRQDPGLDVRGEPLRGYRLLEKLGDGAFGEVYRASQPQVGRDVAVKVVHPELANQPDFVRRFEREAQLVARLEHPHVVPLYDYWREPDAAYLIMRYLRGGNLEQVLEDGPVEPARVATILDQVASGLAAAHRQGVVHRDVKPANVLLDDDGNAYLGDFGIALDAGAPEQTQGTMVRGTPAYLSPEQIRLEPATPRSDIYALGIVVYEAITGLHPFHDSGITELLDRHLHRQLPSIREVRPELPAAVDTVIARATAKDASIRFHDATELAAAFRGALEGAVGVASSGPTRNPFKGLRAFLEADAADFFGREALVRRLVERLAEPHASSRFLCVVGPSGSGKSSLVRAGLVPALHRGAVAGSDRWYVVDLLPGAHPMRELERALLAVAVEPPPSLLDDLERNERGLLDAVGRLLPEPGAELVLVVDQLEEAFTLAEDEDERARFLSALASATAPGSRVRVIATLRADFYDRPLSVRGFGELLAARSEAITPMSTDDLERAIVGPAERVGLEIEPSLVGTMIADVVDRPGALPLLQFALTELAERATGARLTLEAYREIRGVSGALARRAEQLFGTLSDAAKEACRQVLLRLVALGEGTDDTRRRVRRSDLPASDAAAVDTVLEAFGRHRLLSFDRDAGTREPTVEIAHEALLTAWSRLRAWIDDARDDLRTRLALASSTAEWERSGRDESFLLRGTRLDHLAEWADATTVDLAPQDAELLSASVAARAAERAAQHERERRERALEQRSVRRMRALIAVLTAAALVAATLTVIAVDRGREAERGRADAAVLALTGASLSNLTTRPEVALSLALHAIALSADLGEPVPAATVEAFHWAFQESGVQYPTTDAAIVTAAGPLGLRGLYDVPLGELADLALPHAPDRVRADVCDRSFGEIVCPELPARFPSDLAAAPVGSRTTGGAPLQGTTITIAGVQDEGIASELESWAVANGVRIDFADPVFGTDPFEGVPGPDIGVLAVPGLVPELAAKGELMDVGAYLDLDRIRADYAPYLRSLATIGPDGSWPSETGTLYGGIPALTLKSLVWYPQDAFEAAGYEIPTTWQELLELMRRIKADGDTPWCLGLESGDFDGWPATDWVENLLLGEAGPDVYDAWTFHELPFTDPAVHRAFERFGEIVFGDGNVRGGPSGAISAGIDVAHQPMLTDPPGCWLYFYASFFGYPNAFNVPAGIAGQRTAAFAFPPPGSTNVSLGAGSLVVATADRPEVREAMRFILSPEFGQDWFASGAGSFASNLRFDRSIYDPFWGARADELARSLEADTFRFDASDMMPSPIGDSLFWADMVRYVDEGPSSLDAILAQLEDAWPDSG